MADAELSYDTDLRQRIQTALGPLLLLLILYYGYTYLVYETTIKRSIYEASTSLFPEKLRRVLQHSILRVTKSFLGHVNHLEDMSIKSQSSQHTPQDEGLSSAFQRARKFSGLEKLNTPISDVIFPGLGNWDNSCFQNSVLQGLASLQSFKLSVEANRRACLAAGTDAPVLEGLQTFLSQLQEGSQNRRSLWPPSVLRSMNTWQQQDAQEYLSKILDSIEKELTKAQKLVNKRSMRGLGCLRTQVEEKQDFLHDATPVEALVDQSDSAHRSPNSLEGYLSQKLRCETCGFSEGLSLMSFNCLTLNLGLGGSCHLENLLDTYFEPERIDGVECDECTRLSEETSASETSADEVTKEEQSEHTPDVAKKASKILSTKTKNILFGRLPQNLAFHINRSIFDDWGNQRKNNAFVEFPAQLRIWKEWMEDFGEGDKEICATYKLRCIINHSGRHDNGHYVACGKRGEDWYLFNDEIVIKTNEADVLARGNVFMLFYEKVEYDSGLAVSTPRSSDTSESTSPSSYGDTTQELSVASTNLPDAPLSAAPAASIPTQH